MECGYARLTVWFADPFWVGVYEREARRAERAQRHRQRDAAEEERRFRLRQERKKEKRRGH